MEFKFKTLVELIDYFHDEAICYEFLEQAIWKGTPCCPHCASINVTPRAQRSRLKSKQNVKEYRCREIGCGKHFSPTVGTIFEASKIPLRKWYAAMWLSATTSKGISSLSLSKQIGTTQKTAWFMLSRIREMLADTDKEPMGGEGVIVEVDETIVGGKVKNMSNKKRKNISDNPSHRTANKTTVVGIVERSSRMRLEVVKKGDFVPDIIVNAVDTNSVLMTDTANTYVAIGKQYAHHATVDHTKNEYGRDKIVHTNTIEGAFSHFDRMVLGVYHSISQKHLTRYCNEFTHRYNNRLLTNEAKFNTAVAQVNTKRIRYVDLVKKVS